MEDHRQDHHQDRRLAEDHHQDRLAEDHHVGDLWRTPQEISCAVQVVHLDRLDRLVHLDRRQVDPLSHHHYYQPLLSNRHFYQE